MTRGRPGTGRSADRSPKGEILNMLRYEIRPIVTQEVDIWTQKVVEQDAYDNLIQSMNILIRRANALITRTQILKGK